MFLFGKFDSDLVGHNSVCRIDDAVISEISDAGFVCKDDQFRIVIGGNGIIGLRDGALVSEDQILGGFKRMEHFIGQICLVECGRIIGQSFGLVFYRDDRDRNG